MNQYPGFVPMMVPQHFMVAMPGMPLQGIQPPHHGIPQMMPPSVAVAHAGGMTPVSTAAAIAQGMPLAARQAAPPGMGAALPGLTDQRQFVDARANPGFPGMGVPLIQQEATEPEQDDSRDNMTILDEFNSDLNLVIDSDGYGAHTLNQPSGFCFTWAGVRATHGICKGKGFYEVHITEHLPVDFGDDHNETDPHVIRVGWSIDSSPFQLGEEPWSYGYGGTGKFSTNNKFTDYGGRFEAGDVIGVMVNLDERPATISYMKNGKWLGVALPLHSYPVGNRDMALYPHILSKNCRFKVNFGQIDPWFPPPQMYPYIGLVPDKVRGMKAPENVSDCEMIMIVGLPGAGKTTWGINMYKSHPEKRYNIIGTDTLIEKMRVMGLPRKRNYHGRWDALINKASQCLNKLFTIAGKRKRNYILDQTNVYPSARRKKMRNFTGFYRIAAVLQPEDPELLRRSHKRTVEDGKIVPEEAVLEMKANFTLPEDRDNLFDRIDFIEQQRENCITLVEQYNREGQEKRPPRELVFKHDNLRDGRNQQNFRGGDNRPHDQSSRQSRLQQDRNQGYDGGRQDRSRSGYQRDYPSPPSKRIKSDAGSALDFIKQYGGGEEDHSGQAAANWSEKTPVKEEPTWDQAQYGWPQQQQQYGDTQRGPGQPQQVFNQRGASSQWEQSRQNNAGGPEGRGPSQSWPPYGGGGEGQQNWQNRDQVDRKPWLQGGADQPGQQSFNAQDNARGFGGQDSSRGFGNRQDAPGGYGSQQSGGFGGQQRGYGAQQGGYGSQQSGFGSQQEFGQQESRQYGQQDSRRFNQDSRNFGQKDDRNFGQKGDRNFGQKDDRNFGQKEDRNFGQKDDRNFGQKGDRNFSQQESRSYDQDQRNFGQQDSRSYGQQDSRNFNQQDRNFGQGNSSGYGSQQTTGFGRQHEQQMSGEGFGSQRSGGFEGASYGGKSSSDGFRDQRSRNPSYERGNGPNSYGRESDRNSFNQFGGPPPPPPKEPQESDRFSGEQPFEQNSSNKVAAPDPKSDDAASRSGPKTERVRRRKSKWDTPSADPPINLDIASLIESSQIPPVDVKEEPVSDVDNRQQYSEKPEQQLDSVSSANDSPNQFGRMDLNRPPPDSSWKNSQNDQDQFANQRSSSDRGRPNMRGEDMSPSNQYGSDNQFGGEAQKRGPPFNQGGPGNPNMRPPFEPRHPHGGPRFPPGGNRGPRPNFGQGGPMPFRPRNPQNFGGQPGGPSGGGPPGGWNQNRPRFGPRGPRPPFNPRFGPDGGQRFPRPPGQPRFSRP